MNIVDIVYFCFCNWLQTAFEFLFLIYLFCFSFVSLILSWIILFVCFSLLYVLIVIVCIRLGMKQWIMICRRCFWFSFGWLTVWMLWSDLPCEWIWIFKTPRVAAEWLVVILRGEKHLTEWCCYHCSVLVLSTKVWSELPIGWVFNKVLEGSISLWA